MFAFAAPCLKGKLSEVGLLLLFGADPATDCDVLDESDEDGDKCKEFPLSKKHDAIVEMLLGLACVNVNQATSGWDSQG